MNFSAVACNYHGLPLIRILLVVSLVHLWNVPVLRAQPAEDSVVMLLPLEITHSRLRSFTVGDKVESIEGRIVGTADHLNLSRLLNSYSSINVRSYGNSGLATASLRGSGSNHTPVFWEGVNLQSSMNGHLDLSQMPVAFFDQISLQYGSTGSLYGAGTVGGAIHLHSAPEIEPGFHGKLYQQLGSYASQYTGIRAEYKKKALAFRLRSFVSQAENDFTFYNVYRNRDEQRRHAATEQRGLLAESFISWTPTHRITAKYWLQDNRVEIPGVAASGGGNPATQEDRFHRTLVRWDYSGNRYQLKAQAARIGHRLQYFDQTSDSSLSLATTWVSELENTFFLNQRQWLLLGIIHTFERARVNHYGNEAPQRHRTSLLLSYRGQLGSRIESSLGVRQELIDQSRAPVLPSLSLAYTLSKQWRLRAKVARSYHLPTFNDLYWQGSSLGNPDLRPEIGWTAEAGSELTYQPTDRWSWQGEVTVYTHLTDDWIQWLPIPPGNRWSPINLQKVWARGVEASAESASRYPFGILRGWVSYSYTRATKVEIDSPGNPASLHKQLIYTPSHQGKAAASVDYHRLTAGLTGAYTGQQFSSESQQQVLPAFVTFDITLGYRWELGDKHCLKSNAGFNNVFNKQYEIRRGYPMPGRNYQLSIIYEFN